MTAPSRIDDFDLPSGVTLVAGGETRKASSLAALEAAGDAAVLLVHDAARPFLSRELIDRVLAGVAERGAAGVALPVTDTLRRVGEGAGTVDRRNLWAMQTPQGATAELLRRAHRASPEGSTDDLAMIEAIGVHPAIVPGDPNNFKITHPEDLARAQALLGIGEIRTGLGYDIHPFSDDPSRELWLGGVRFPGHRALDGHSDADALLHAATDALLGAAAMGDIGQHFPNTDARWRGAPSIQFLRHAAALLQADGWAVVNLDMTVIAESPKVMKQSIEIRTTVAEAIGIEVDRVSVKATTNERLGAIGRSEGIAAFATSTIQRR